MMAVLLTVSCAMLCDQPGTQSPSPLPVPASIHVSVAPRNPSIQTNQMQKFTVTVVNDSQNKGVAWSLGCTGTCDALSPSSTAMR